MDVPISVVGYLGALGCTWAASTSLEKCKASLLFFWRGMCSGFLFGDVFLLSFFFWGGGDVFSSFSPTAESFGVSGRRGKVPQGFDQGCTRVSPGFHEVLRGLRGGASSWGELFFFGGGLGADKDGLYGAWRLLLRASLMVAPPA